MLKRLRSADPNKRRLFKNTIFLYILVFSGYFFALITVPYLTRVLGPETYGKIGWAGATMSYFALVVDFGFLLSATEQIARHQRDKKEVEKIVGAVTISKMLLAGGGLAFVVCLSFFWSKMATDPWFYILMYIATIAPSFMLDFFYRGIEQMQVITIRTVIVKAFFTLCIFVFLKNENQYWMVPVFNFLGAALAVAIVYYHMVVKLKYKLVFPEWSYTWKVFKYSTGFFYSRIASSVYSYTNLFLLGFVYPVKSVPMGAYTGADKIMNIMNQAFGPIADSLYPYMVRKKDFLLLKKLLLIFMPITLTGLLLIGFFAEPLCIWFFGQEFASTAPILRLMLPIVAITLPSYLLGFPSLSPLGGAKAVNDSVIYSAVLQIIMLAILFATGTFTVYTVVIATFISELFVLIYRTAALWYYWKRYQATISH